MGQLELMQVYKKKTMFKNILVVVFTVIINIGCLSVDQDTFNCEELVSTKGERVYVNTLNWGVTDDHQISAISNNKDKVRERSDTLNVIKGLDPFVYKFKNDTLTLYFDGKVRYKIENQFKSIVIKYVSLNKKSYRAIHFSAAKNEGGCSSVPRRVNIEYPLDMPLPTSS